MDEKGRVPGISSVVVIRRALVSNKKNRQQQTL
jgi:hypothetical protein